VRYYLRGDLLDTVFATDPSPTWKGIEFGLKLLKQGVIHRIGDGGKTNIFRDNCLPRDQGLIVSAKKKNSRRRELLA
jgi:hypothetical protein